MGPWVREGKGGEVVCTPQDELAIIKVLRNWLACSRSTRDLWKVPGAAGSECSQLLSTPQWSENQGPQAQVIFYGALMDSRPLRAPQLSSGSPTREHLFCVNKKRSPSRLSGEGSFPRVARVLYWDKGGQNPLQSSL